jgi:hypothetical protein
MQTPDGYSARLMKVEIEPFTLPSSKQNARFICLKESQNPEAERRLNNHRKEKGKIALETSP